MARTICIRCPLKKNFTKITGKLLSILSPMSGSSHIRCVLIGVEYRNCRRTLDVYLLFAFWVGQIQSKLIYMFLTYRLARL